MSEKKQSSVDWFEARMLEILSPLNMVMSHEQWEMYDKAHEQAKAMHKDEIETAYQSERYPCSDYDAQEYYNQTYGE